MHEIRGRNKSMSIVLTLFSIYWMLGCGSSTSKVDNKNMPNYLFNSSLQSDSLFNGFIYQVQIHRPEDPTSYSETDHENSGVIHFLYEDSSINLQNYWNKANKVKWISNPSYNIWLGNPDSLYLFPDVLSSVHYDTIFYNYDDNIYMLEKTSLRIKPISIKLCAFSKNSSIQLFKSIWKVSNNFLKVETLKIKSDSFLVVNVCN